MSQTYLLRGARQLLTLRGPQEPRRGSQLSELSIINDGALLIRDGLIAEVGPTQRVENLKVARGAIEIDATRHVVMPSFVDSGINLVYAHSATGTNDARAQCGVSFNAYHQREDILTAVRALRLISSARLASRATLLLNAMAKHGTGSAQVISGLGLDYTCELKSLRIAKSLDGSPLDLFSSYMGGNTLPEEFQSEPAAYLERVASPLFPLIARRKLARSASIRCAAGGFDMESSAAYLTAATEAGMNLSVHSQQFGPDDSARLAVSFKAASLLHLEHLKNTDIDVVARSRTVAVLTPAATFHMGLTRFAPARELIAHGAAVALATAFNPADSPSFSMPFVLTLACRYLGMTPAEAISAATINAAYAHGAGAQVGSLEAGKQANLLILNTRDYRDLPQQPGVNLVHTVMHKGKLL